MTILVTGATGYIGSRVVLQLAKRNLEIVAADLDMGKNKDKLKEKYISGGNNLNLLKFEKLDITNFQNIESIFEKYNFDSVINLAYGIGMICEVENNTKPLLQYFTPDRILLTSECGFGHVPIEITRAKLKKLVESAKYLRTKFK